MFEIISFTLLVLYFILLLFIVLKEKKSKNTIDFFFAGRSMPFWALSLTFVASWWGAGSAIETVDSAFNTGIGAYWIYGMPVLLSSFIMIFFNKYIRKIGFLTQSAIMKERYSNNTARMLALMVLLFMILNASTQMVGIGKLFSTYLDIDYTLSIILGTVMVTTYSVTGGFRGVVITDIIQFGFLLFSAIAVFITVYNNSGGVENIKLAAEELGRYDFFNFFAGANEYAIYAFTFGVSWVIQANVWQRIAAAPSPKDSTKLAIMSFFIYIPLYLMVVLTGMAAIGIYDNIPEGGILISVVKDYMHPVLASLVFLGLSAAIMSTMDSLINTGAMTFSLDLLPKYMNDNKRLFISRAATIIIALIGMFIAILIPSILELSFVASDIITTGVFVPLIMSFIWKKGTSKGALTSMIFGLFFSIYNLLITQGVNLPALWQAKSVYQSIIGVIISFMLFISISLITQKKCKS